MADDFFNKDETQTEQPQTVKIGEKEYNQEELSKLVGLGEVAQEYETKWNRPIKDFYPDFTQKSQRLAELERKEAERQQVAEEMRKKQEEEEQKELEKRAAEGKLTPEEQRQAVIKQAKEYGLVTKDEVEAEMRRIAREERMAEKILGAVDTVVTTAVKEGKPQANAKDLLNFMSETGIKDPDKAYKLMFEDELDKWKEEKLKGIRPNGMTTQTGSTAGAKTPPPAKPITKDNLGSAIRDALTRSRGV